MRARADDLRGLSQDGVVADVQWARGKKIRMQETFSEGNGGEIALCAKTGRKTFVPKKMEAKRTAVTLASSLEKLPYICYFSLHREESS